MDSIPGLSFDNTAGNIFFCADSCFALYSKNYEIYHQLRSHSGME